MTDNELADHYQRYVDCGDFPPISPSGLRSRRKELVDMGKVVDTGRRLETPSGRACICWGDAYGELW